jgi:hypothetical protein
MMRLQLEVTNVDHANHRVHTKTLNPAPTYQLSKRAVESFEVGQILEALVQLPYQDPINDCDKSTARHIFNLAKGKLQEILCYWPETKCFGALSGLEVSLEAAKRLLHGEEQGIPRHGQCAYVSNAGGLVQYAKAFSEMCPDVRTSGAGIARDASVQLVFFCESLLKEMQIEPWKTSVG